MKTKLILAFILIFVLQSCSGQPRIIQQKSMNNVMVQTMSIEDYVAYHGSLHKMKGVLHEGVEYINGEWSNAGTYIKAVDKITREEIWRYPVQADSLTNPVFDETRIFFGTSLGMYYALDKKTGKEMWSYKSPKEIYDFNNIHKKSLIFRDYDSKLYCLDSETGNLKWTFELSSLFGIDYSIYTGPTYSSGVLFFALNQNLLLGIDADTGLEKWRKEYNFKAGDDFYIQHGYIATMENTKFKKIDSNIPRENIFKFDEIVNPENLYVNLHVFDIQKGSLLWSRKLVEREEKKYEDQTVTMIPPLWTFYVMIRYEQPPIFTKQKIFFNDRYLSLQGFDLRTGKSENEIDLLPYHIQRKFYANSMTISGNYAYFTGTDETLTNVIMYSLNLVTGKKLWEKPLGKKVEASFQVLGPYLFLNQTGSLLVMLKKNGNEIQNIEIPFPFTIDEILKKTILITHSGPNPNPKEYAYELRW